MLSEISQSEKDKYHMIHSYVESNAQIQLTRKIRNRLIDSRMTAIRGRGMEQKGKCTHGRGQQRGDCREERGIRGLSGNGKNAIN